MAIHYRTGDLLVADAEALVNTVNCVGVMGKGIALQFKNRFPTNFKAYYEACERNAVTPGHMFVTERPNKPRYIINFPTKRHWRAKSRLDDVQSGLVALAEEIRSRNVRSIAIPALGCGNGGLEWRIVRPLIERELGELAADVHIMIFQPDDLPSAQAMAELNAPSELTFGRAALLLLMHRYLAKQLRDVTLPESVVHAMVYLLTAAGEPLPVDYSKSNSFPYTDDLCRVLLKMEERWIHGSQTENGGRLLMLRPGAADDAERFVEIRQYSRKRITKVVDLMDGFESPTGVRLLALTHRAAHGQPRPHDEVIHQLRMSEFYPKQIEQAYLTLDGMGWLPDEKPVDEDGRQSDEGGPRHPIAGEMSDVQSTDDGALVDVNTASVDELEELPSIGVGRARSIVEYRDRFGPFHATSDLTRVPSIGTRLYQKVCHRVTVGEHGHQLF